MATLNLKQINKTYSNGVQAVFDFNLNIKDGEFIVLVGPSGCGKSTTLRMIAGLEGISSGELLIDGRNVNDVAPSDRDIAMVFQDYALYGNMTVYQNMGFSLTVRKQKQEKIHNAVMNVADVVDLKEYLNRFPRALSGGQRQRVSLGRSIARSAKVFLMDEPLSNLDAKLRLQTRKKLVEIHNTLAATIIYVTHDQIEAMTMATRIVVMSDGYVQQTGTPFEVYNFPENLFVAGFMGLPAMNFIEGKVEKDFFVANDCDIRVKLPEFQLKKLKEYDGKTVVLGIRPENIHVEQAKKTELKNYIYDSHVAHVELLGSEYHAQLDVCGKKIIARIPSREEVKPYSGLKVAFDINKIHFFDTETKKRIKLPMNHISGTIKITESVSESKTVIKDAEFISEDKKIKILLLREHANGFNTNEKVTLEINPEEILSEMEINHKNVLLIDEENRRQIRLKNVENTLSEIASNDRKIKNNTVKKDLLKTKETISEEEIVKMSDSTFMAKLEKIENIGNRQYIEFDLFNNKMTAIISTKNKVEIGKEIKIGFDVEKIKVIKNNDIVKGEKI